METNPLDSFRNQTEPDDLRLARVARRVRLGLDSPPVPWYSRWLAVDRLPYLVGVPAIAALLWAIFPAVPPKAPEPGPPALAQPAENTLVPAHAPTFPLENIASTPMTGSGGSLALVDQRVQLSWDGSGQVSGTSHAPQVDWAAGKVTVEVSPNQGIALSVHTREATIQVIGTGFTVNRDELGTRVEVLHGRVRVACAGDSEANATLLSEGQKRLCMPTTGVGLLARARALQTSHASMDEVLATIERGLTVAAGQQSVEDELTVLKIQTLADLNRSDEALKVADQWLIGLGNNVPRSRETEVRRYAASLAMAQSQCDAVVNYLGPLVSKNSSEPANVEDLILHGTCLSKNHPEQAREELETAQKLSHTPEQQAAITAALNLLGKLD